MSSFTIERKKLYDEIWDISARKVAGKYGISYSRLLSKCRECNIPLPPSGYFTKLQFGKPVTQANLPESDIQYVTIESPDSSKSLEEPATFTERTDRKTMVVKRPRVFICAINQCLVRALNE